MRKLFDLSKGKSDKGYDFIPVQNSSALIKLEVSGKELNFTIREKDRVDFKIKVVMKDEKAKLQRNILHLTLSRTGIAYETLDSKNQNFRKLISNKKLGFLEELTPVLDEKNPILDLAKPESVNIFFKIFQNAVEEKIYTWDFEKPSDLPPSLPDGMDTQSEPKPYVLDHDPNKLPPIDPSLLNELLVYSQDDQTHHNNQQQEQTQNRTEPEQHEFLQHDANAQLQSYPTVSQIEKLNQSIQPGAETQNKASVERPARKPIPSANVSLEPQSKESLVSSINKGTPQRKDQAQTRIASVARQSSQESTRRSQSTRNKGEPPKNKPTNQPKPKGFPVNQEAFNELLKEFKSKTAYLIRKAKNDKAYEAVATAAQNLYKQLHGDSVEYYNNPTPTDYETTQFKVHCRKLIEGVEKDFGHHRGFGDLHWLLKAFIGILAIPVSPFWSCIADNGYVATFYGKPPTRASKELAEYKSNFEPSI